MSNPGASCSMFNNAETMYEVEHLSAKHHLTSIFRNHMARYYCGDRSVQGIFIAEEWRFSAIFSGRERARFEILLGVSWPLLPSRAVCIGLSGARTRISHGVTVLAPVQSPLLPTLHGNIWLLFLRQAAGVALCCCGIGQPTSKLRIFLF
jgi:hypothetical protein